MTISEPIPPSWIGPITLRVRRWRDAGVGPAWVVAVSGGGDSVGLLRVLHALASEVGLVLSVAHLDHGARGAAARRDAEFVAALAATLGLPIDLGQWRPTRAGHFEADARRARYDWLIEVARARGASAVAVGHTRDDQAETILHRIVRGTGVRGLAGIPARRALTESIALVRPLLTVGRAEVRAELARLGQPFREDASNADVSRTRARIRHDLLPKLAADYNPAVVAALVRLGALAAESERDRRGMVRDRVRAATFSADHETVRLWRAVLRQWPRFARAEVLRHVWRRAGWPEAAMGADRWRRLAALAGSDRVRTDVGGGVELTTNALFFTMRRRVAPPKPGPVALGLPGSAAWPGGRVVASFDPSEPRDETIALDALTPPFQVRAPVAGDRFGPLGMDGRTLSLNDFFRGRRVARDQRGRVPLVCDRQGIIWVVGHRIAHRARLTAETNHAVGLRWVEDEGLP